MSNSFQQWKEIAKKAVPTKAIEEVTGRSFGRWADALFAMFLIGGFSIVAGIGYRQYKKSKGCKC